MMHLKINRLNHMKKHPILLTNIKLALDNRA
jgi:hypothetical protein